MSGVAIMMASKSSRVSLGGPGTLTLSGITTSPANASAWVSLENDGDIAQILNGVTSDIGDWIAPKMKAGGDFECRFTVFSGSLVMGSDAPNSWLSLSSTRSWGVERTLDAAGTNTVEGELEIRQTGSGLLLALRAVQLNAQVT